MADFEIIRGSILPQLPISLQQPDGSAVDLTTATDFRLVVAEAFETEAVDLLIDKTLTLVSATGGRLIAAWVDGDTDVVADCPQQAMVIVTFPEGEAKFGPFSFLIREAVLAG